MPWSATTSHLTWYNRILEEVAKKHGFSMNKPIEKLSEENIKTVLYGPGKGEKYKISIERGIGAYVMNLKKQAGDSVETEVRIKLPDGVTPLSVYPRAGILDGTLIFGMTMEKSDQAVVEFAVNDLFR